MAVNFKPKIFGKVSMRLRLSPDWPTALKTNRKNTKLKTAERHHGCFASLLSINLNTSRDIVSLLVQVSMRLFR